MSDTAPPVTLPLPVCPRCGLPCPANELACYRHCEACEVAGLPETPVRGRLADRALPGYGSSHDARYHYRVEELKDLTNQEVGT